MFRHFYKGDKSFGRFFCFLHTKPLLKGLYSKTKQLPSPTFPPSPPPPRPLLLPLENRSLLRRDVETILTELHPPDNVSFPLKAVI